MTHRPYTDVYLQAYSGEHVFYEIDMLFGVGNLIAKRACIVAATPEDKQRLNNLVIEGFGIHVRNIVDFLYLPQDGTDVVAADFCVPRDWEAACPPISMTLKAAKTRANKELAHLTTSRLSGNPPEKQWAAAALMVELNPLIKRFLVTARPTSLSHKLKIWL